MPRDRRHDYRSRCIYHITICKAPGVPDFSRVIGPPENVLVQRSPIGEVVERNLVNIPDLSDRLRLYQYSIMPDHIHALIFATDRLDRVLGSYIGMLKVKIHQELRERSLLDKTVFEEDFYDRILRPKHSLNTIFNYIRNNPYRLAVRREYPDYFQRANDLNMYGRQWQAYGNLQLLDNPFKEQVVIYRCDSEEIREAHHDRWIHTAANGGVLVSPFISTMEKEIRKEAETVAGKIILLSNTHLTRGRNLRTTTSSNAPKDDCSYWLLQRDSSRAAERSCI